MKRLSILMVLFLPLLTACGGGGGGGVTNFTTSCIVQGNGQITCISTPAGGGTSTPEPSASAFPVEAPIQGLLTSGFSGSGYYSDPYTQAGTYSLTKTVAAQAFGGQQSTAVVTTTNWPNTSSIVSSWRGYITPYTLYFDNAGDLLGFAIDGLYGLRSSGGGFPNSANAGDSGVISQFQMYSDAALTVSAGTATANWSVANCCDLWSKQNGQLTIRITALNPNGSSRFTYSMELGINTSGAFRLVVKEGFIDSSGNEKRLYIPAGS